MADIFKQFREHSVAEFFKKNKHMLGFVGKVRSLTTAVHEYVTNSLDACEEAAILPDIFVQLDQVDDEVYKLVVRDNGPGIPPKIAPKVFGKLLAGTKFHRMIQTRGQQGIGAAAVTIFAQMTTGKPVHVKTSDGSGVIHEMDIMMDVKKNEPIVLNKQRYFGKFRGTEVTAYLGEVQYNRGQYSVYEYLRRTAIANPHVTVTFVEPGGKKFVFYRTSFTPVVLEKEAKPHPMGLTPDDLLTIARRTRARTVASMLLRELQAFGQKTLQELRKLVSVDLEKKPEELTFAEAAEIVKAFRKMKFRAPSTDVLIPIGEPQIRKSLKAHFSPKFVAVVTRKPKVYRGGIPFQVEVGIAFGGNIESFTLMRFANRVPLLFDAGGCAITQAVNSVNWKNYGIDDLRSAPIVIFVNLVSTHVPYTTAGKQAIADIPEVYEEIRAALMDAGRKLREYTSKLAQLEELLHKKKILEHYLPEVATGLARILEKDPKDIQNVLMEALSEKYKKLEELMAKVG